MTMLVGKQAPDFTSACVMPNNIIKDDFNFYDYIKGKIAVLFFWPADFTFVWFTDGQGWNSARHNLEETFDVLEHIYNINDMENGIISQIMK